ncbi:hypothetical protein GCM10010358_70650 [Streptomyces minutiscleroticus]|uniref:Uncharacterized protein n=1 Tax=Streptomyces minutiscleroticus TaxID=68238 RepID=A0A918NZC5_9ACTN|nr:hypothetical protein [Streptomyces minutiscleroticus]GGY07368.1 hypothetical protein GCM10010358_70650 [Streptomyces minutiscleroticus]
MRSGQEVIERLSYLRQIAGTQQHADLIAACLDRLDLFRLSRQVAALEAVLDTVVGPVSVERRAA